MNERTLTVLYENEDIIAIDKPCGQKTHANSAKERAFLPNKALSAHSQCEQYCGQRLGIHQRLDADTSGVLVFSKSRYGAKKLAFAFEQRKLSKRYIALLVGRVPREYFDKSGVMSLEHRIVVDKPHCRVVKKGGKKARSVMRFLDYVGPFTRVEFQLITGITHQLRVQSSSLGFPILGDQRYGGGALTRLMLHAQSLVFDDDEMPDLFAPASEILANADFHTLLGFLFDASQKTENAVIEDSSQARVIMHPSFSGLPKIIVEQLAQCLVFRRYEEKKGDYCLWSKENLEVLFTFVKKRYPSMCTVEKIHPLHERQTGNGQVSFPQQRIISSGHIASDKHSSTHHHYLDADFTDEISLIVTEHGLKYHLLLDNKVGYGLYLDQYDNRRWVKTHATGEVLNLFAYTCAFSVVAASVGASTTSVDISKHSLHIGRQNFALNFADNELEGKKHRFVAEDVLTFVQRQARKNARYNMIILDPPSFGRAKKKTFSLQQSLEMLIMSCMGILHRGGILFFSLNHRGISLAELKRVMINACKQNSRHFEILRVVDSPKVHRVLSCGTELKTLVIRIH